MSPDPFAYLETHWPEHLARTQAFLRQPSVSAQNWGVRTCADLLADWLRERGATVELHGAQSHPILFAEWDVGAPRTLLGYGMYDVQPVDDQVWTTPPFAAEIWDHPRGGESIVARGACNSKGPLMAFLHAIEAYTHSGGLPCNVKWTIEGEEEIGSLALPGFYADQRERLRADGAFEAFWSQDTPDSPPHIILGTKGVVGLDLVCSPGAWGGATEVIHSSLGVWFGNPAWRLIQALATLIDADQVLQIDGLPRLTGQRAGDQAILRAMAEQLDLADELRQVKAARFKGALSPHELAEALSFAPMLNINGLRSGYLGEGSHTILPNEARAACDLRLPPGLKVDEAVAAIRAHLDRRGFSDIALRVDSGYPAARTDVDAPIVQAMIAAYRSLGHEPSLQPVEPSATPYYLYTDVLGIPFVWGGLGSAGGSHGPDEWCSVAGLRALMRSTAAFIHEFARTDDGGR